MFYVFPLFLLSAAGIYPPEGDITKATAKAVEITLHVYVLDCLSVLNKRDLSTVSHLQSEVEGRV